MRLVATDPSNASTDAAEGLGERLSVLIPLWNQDRSDAYAAVSAETDAKLRHIRPSTPHDSRAALSSALEKFTHLQQAILARPPSAELWTNALLDAIDECYCTHLRPFKKHLGDSSHAQYMSALGHYFDIVSATCAQHWLHIEPRVRKLPDPMHAAALADAPERLKWWKTMALNVVTLALPVPTRSFIVDLADNVKHISRSVYMVRTRVP